jgi:hypothetical protein
MVRAKFKVDSVKQAIYGGIEEIASTIELSPVYKNNDPNSENSQFFRWTPSGKIELAVLRPETAAQFELGKEYYIDFTPAE